MSIPSPCSFLDSIRWGAKTLADGAALPTTRPSDETANPLLELFSDQADLMDAIIEEAMHRRRTAPMTIPCE